ncbi:MAG: alpha/beta hydrolase [Hyphomicrobiaceae bacterium]|nr:alpha/beta hydrolase [Hyphomicrobiaceae bacterium]
MSFALIDGRRIEYAAIPGDAGSAPTLVFLHEGLGSVALWRDFPRKVARRLNAPALVYSRFGYGASDGLTGKRVPRFMHDEALDILPSLLDRLSIESPVLIGHSDGASIALIYAAAAGRPVPGLVCLAPHVFVETVCVETIAKVRKSYFETDLKQRLAKYHTNVDDAFLGWADAWLNPEFLSWSIEDLLGRIDQPLLLIQGRNDEYGTLAQLDRIEARVEGPTRRLVLSSCGHSPHRDHEAAVLDAIVAFVEELR